MGYLGRRIGLSQDQGDSNPGGADGAVGGGILDLFANGYFERQGDIYNAPGIGPAEMAATGGVVADYESGGLRTTMVYLAQSAQGPSLDQVLEPLGRGAVGTWADPSGRVPPRACLARG